MAWQLSAEVTRFLLTPAAQGLGQSERVVLYALAERANDDGRHARLAWDSSDWTLETLVGVTHLKFVLRRLADHGLDVRVQRGTDATGRPIYAYKGRQTTYRLPELDIVKEVAEAPPLVAEAPPLVAEAPPLVAEAPPSPSLPRPNSILPVLKDTAAPLEQQNVDAVPGGIDNQQKGQETTMSIETEARRVLQAATTGLFKTKISPREADKLLRLAITALSRVSALELKAHLTTNVDLNAVASPVGLLVHRLTHLPESSAHRPVSGPSVAHPQHPQPEIDFRTQEEIQLAAETAATAIAAAKEQIRIAREKASAARRGARPARHLHSVA